MDYLKLLQTSYKYWLDDNDREYETKYNFLADAVFNITTYENLLSAKMAEEWLQVCKAISERKTFDMISTPEGNDMYLRTVNYPFFSKHISWGCSIRGAFWDSALTIKSCYLIDEKGEQILELVLTNSWDGNKIDKFVQAMVVFVSE